MMAMQVGLGGVHGWGDAMGLANWMEVEWA